MARPRRSSNVSNSSSMPEQVSPLLLQQHHQSLTTPLKELGNMYDYLAKIILLGPSGSGK